MAWVHLSEDGIATNKDPIFGGIVDTNVDGWFAIPNNDRVDMKEGFATKKDAISYIAESVRDVEGVEW